MKKFKTQEEYDKEIQKERIRVAKLAYLSICKAIDEVKTDLTIDMFVPEGIKVDGEFFLSKQLLSEEKI